MSLKTKKSTPSSISKGTEFSLQHYQSHKMDIPRGLDNAFFSYFVRL